MKLFSRIALSASAATLAGLVGLAVTPAQAQTAYAITTGVAGAPLGSASLIRFDIANPLSAVLVGTFNGDATALDAIDFRPLNGQLYGYLTSTNTLYTVDVNTAALTAVVGGPSSIAGNNLAGIDFNPVIDRVRVVNEAAENFVLNPNPGGAVPAAAAPLTYPDTDVAAQAGASPLVVENAYTNSNFGRLSTSTVQYGIDYGTDSLVTIANNLGTLGTVGGTLGNLGIDLNDDATYAGFDIFTSALGVNTGYGLFDTTTGLAPTLYTIDLGTGAATSVGAIGGFTQVYSLAVTPSAAAPEPGTIALTLLGGGALAGRVVVRRRKRV